MDSNVLKDQVKLEKLSYQVTLDEFVWNAPTYYVGLLLLIFLGDNPLNQMDTASTPTTCILPNLSS